MSTKVTCLGCGNPILKKTALKYEGYSRQCLAKKKQQELDKEKLLFETSLQLDDDIQFFLEKTNISFPKIYFKEEFNKIWAVPKNTDVYYDKYLARTLIPLIEVEL